MRLQETAADRKVLSAGDIKTLGLIDSSRQSHPRPMFVEIYIDESSQTKSRYLVLGATVLPQDHAIAARDAMMAAKLPELPHGELKWGKVSRSKLYAYQRLTDAFFDHPDLQYAHFHSVVVDTSLVDHRRFNDGSSEIGFNKEIYQLASKCARLYPHSLFHLYPDYRETNQRPEELRNILNHGRRKAGDKRDWPFRRCHFRDSKTTPFLWLSDLFAGSLAFHLNGHASRPDASPARVALSRHILARARIANPFADTAISGKFTVWHRQLRR